MADAPLLERAARAQEERKLLMIKDAWVEYLTVTKDVHGRRYERLEPLAYQVLEECLKRIEIQTS